MSTMRKILQQISIIVFIMFQFTLIQGQNTPKKAGNNDLSDSVKVKSLNAVIFEEDFDDVPNVQIPEDWYSTAGLPGGTNPDVIYCYDGHVNFWRQTQYGPMVLASPEFDFTDATLLTFDFTPEEFDDVLTLQVGIMTDPEDPTTFELIATFIPEEDDLYTTLNYSVILSEISGIKHLAFREFGLPYDYFSMDNIIITDLVTNWPDTVTNVNALAGENGANHALISWTNPTMDAGGDPLNALDSITIAFDGEILYTMNNPEIGGDAEVLVDITTPDFYIFDIIAHNSNGPSGVQHTPQIWIGMDTPGAVSNLVLTETNDNTANLSWEPPTIGAHGGWFDGLITEYKIIRADGVEYYADGSETTYSTVLNIPGTYAFTVIPVSYDEGTEAQSNVKAFYFNGYLLWEDFWVSVPAMDWTITGDGSEENWTLWPYEVFGSAPVMTLFPTVYFNGSSNMVSPIINTEGLSVINLQFDHLHYYQGTLDSYFFKVLTTSDNGNTWNEVYVLEVDENIPATNAIIPITNEDVGSDNFQFAFSFEGASSDVSEILIDNIRLSESFEIDLTATKIFIQDWIATGDVVPLSGRIENVGLIDVEYVAIMTIHDGTTEIYNSELTGFIESSQNLNLEFENWEAIEGAYDIELTVICDGDENPQNNTTSSGIEVINNAFSRTLVVCEEFTFITCSACPGAAMGLDDLILNNWPVAVIAYHVNDIYNIDEGLERYSYYNIIGCPTVEFDGIIEHVGGSGSTSQYEVYLPYVQDQLTIPSPASIEILDLGISGSTLTADILINSESPISNNNLVLHSVITESHIEEEWLGLDEVNFVARAMSTNAVDLSNQTETISISFELDEAWDQTHSELVVFVQDTESKVVLNGNKQAIITTSITEFEGEDKLEIYPNPASETVSINYNSIIESIEIYNQLGQLAMKVNSNSTSIILNISELEHGVYFIKVFSGNGFETRKLVVE